MNRTILGAVCCAAALAAAAGADAQNGTENYYTPPKMLKQGTSKTPISGDGKVIVQVLVNADGTFAVKKIISSTNHGDDATAREIAMSSTYAPATRGTKKVLAFYDFTLKFAGGSASSGGQSIPSGLAQSERELRAGNYTGAQAGFKSYAAAHPEDQRSQLDLGIADTYLDDYPGASAAFERAGTIPDNYKPVAAKAYVSYAVSLLANKDYAGGLAAAKRGVELEPGFASLDTQGVAELGSGDTAAAVADLEKSHDLAKTQASIPAKSRANNDVHLMQALLASGNLDAAKVLASEAAAADPQGKLDAEVVFAGYYQKKAQDAQATGKFADAAAFYEQAVTVAPSQAANLYASAASAYLKVQPSPDNDKAKADADKALAADANNAAANYVAGIALANEGKKAGALTFLGKAESLAKAAGDTDLAASAESAIKQLNGKT
jgi:hypothetical protein